MAIDKEESEKARMLKEHIENIRAAYTRDFTSEDGAKRQLAVATYLMDKHCLVVGDYKDIFRIFVVSCCTLKVEDVKAIAPNSLEIKFQNRNIIIEYIVEVALPVYEAIIQFQAGKSDSDDLFDKLDSSKLDAHLNKLMPGLEAKVFRTYNECIITCNILNKEIEGGDVLEKLSVYKHACEEVFAATYGLLRCRKIRKSVIAAIGKLQGILTKLKTDLDMAKRGKRLKDAHGKRKNKFSREELECQISVITLKIRKLEQHYEIIRPELGMGYSVCDFVDPRIIVAWCRQHVVPIEKIFTRFLMKECAWALDVGPDFRF